MHRMGVSLNHPRFVSRHTRSDFGFAHRTILVSGPSIDVRMPLGGRVVVALFSRSLREGFLRTLHSVQADLIRVRTSYATATRTLATVQIDQCLRTFTSASPNLKLACPPPRSMPLDKKVPRNARGTALFLLRGYSRPRSLPALLREPPPFFPLLRFARNETNLNVTHGCCAHDS